jgi:hypothetical protein
MKDWLDNYLFASTKEAIAPATAKPPATIISFGNFENSPTTMPPTAIKPTSFIKIFIIANPNYYVRFCQHHFQFNI